jgi:PAS domain S-box-containing protein
VRFVLAIFLLLGPFTAWPATAPRADASVAQSSHLIDELRRMNAYLALAMALAAVAGGVAVHAVRLNRRLQRSEADLSAALRAIPDLIFELDGQGNYLRVRKSQDELLAHPKSDLLGRNVRDVLPPEAARIVMEALEAAKERGSDYGRLIRLPLDKGESWFELAVARRSAGPAEDSVFIVLSRDVTARYQAEEGFQRLSQVVEQSPNAIVIADTAGLVEYVNPAFTALTGYAADEAVGRHARLLMSCRVDAAVRRAVRQTLARGEVWEGELVNRCRDGGEYVTLTSISPLRDRRGRVSHFVGIQIDATELREAQRQARESEQLLRSSIEAIGDGFVVYDADDRLVFCNEEYRASFPRLAPFIEIGRPFEEILRHGLALGQFPDAAGRQEAWLAERVAVHRQGNAEIIQHLDDGRWLKIRERRTPLGHIVGFRVDISELVRAKEAAEAASRAKSQFLATMSHEIRTPMNGILGMAQILSMPKLAEQQRLEYARTLLGAGQSLLALLNDMLDLAKVESGRIELDEQAFVAADLLAELKGLFDEPARQKGLSLSVDWSGPAGRAYVADRHRLRQMLVNLLSNAVKFTEHGAIRVEAGEIAGESGGRQLEFAVEDSGIGIPESSQARIFEPFSQADGSISRHYAGTGLGLSIVRSLARRMGGDAGFSSAAGRGSRFWFRIPAAVADAAAVESPAVPATPGEAIAARFSGRVLFVDDHPLERSVVSALLVKLGLDVSVVGDGRQALDWLAANAPPDLVLMDCQMPVLDGYQATAELRRLPGCAGLPVIALTAGAFDSDRQRCLDAGMDDFLAKPVLFDELAAVIGHWLPSAGGQVAVPEIDTAQLRAWIAELEPMLASQQFDALGRFRGLREFARGTRIEPWVDEIGRLLAAFQFPQALAQLRELAASTGQES